MIWVDDRIRQITSRGSPTAALRSSLRVSQGDLVLVACVGAALALAVALVPIGPESTALRMLGVLLALIEAGSLLWIRKAPAGAMVAALAAGVALPGAVSLRRLMGRGHNRAKPALAGAPPRVSLWGLAAMVVLAPWNAISNGWVQVPIAVGAACFAWAWGEVGRRRELRRQGEMRGAVADERRRIARELHDVIAHNVSVMVVQATAAEDRFDHQPEQAREALRAISSSGRAALSDLRRMLAVVRPEARRIPTPRSRGWRSWTGWRRH